MATGQQVGTAVGAHLVGGLKAPDAGRNPRYFEPLRDLDARRLALGVIDYEGDEARTRELIAAADAGGGREFAVATECGMARIDERGPGSPSLEHLLELHARCAASVR